MADIGILSIAYPGSLLIVGAYGAISTRLVMIENFEVQASATGRDGPTYCTHLAQALFRRYK